MSLQTYLVEAVMQLAWFSNELKGEAAIAWEDVTTEHITQSILNNLEEDLDDLSVKANMGTQSIIVPTGTRRFLQGSNNLRALQIDFVVEVEYRADSDESHSPSDWIEEAFGTDQDRALYVNQLVGTNNEAFDTLQRVELVVEGVAAVQSPPDSTDDGGGPNIIVIATAAGGGALLVVLFGLLFTVNRRNKKQIKRNDEDMFLEDTLTLGHSRGGENTYAAEIVVDGEEDVSTLGVSVFGGALMNRVDEKDEQTASIGEDYDWMKAHGEVLASEDESTADKRDSKAHGKAPASEDESTSDERDSVFSWLSRRSSSSSRSRGLGSRRSSILSNDTSFEKQFEEANVGKKFEVVAPPGKLGMVIDRPKGSVPQVHTIKPDSVMANRVRVGDEVVSVDGNDVTTWSAMQIGKLIASKTNQQRSLVFFRGQQRADSVQS